MEVKKKVGRPRGSKVEPKGDTTTNKKLNTANKRLGYAELARLDAMRKEKVLSRERARRASVEAVSASSFEEKDVMLDALKEATEAMPTRGQIDSIKKNSKRDHTIVHEGLPDIYDVIRDDRIAAKYKGPRKQQRVFVTPSNPGGSGRPKGTKKRTILAREAQYNALTVTPEELVTMRSVPMMERRARFHLAMAQQAMACGELSNAILERDRIALITQHLSLMQEAAEKIAPYQYPRLSNIEVTGRDGAPIEFKEIDPDTMTDEESMAAYLAMARNPGALPTPVKQIEKEKVDK